MIGLLNVYKPKGVTSSDVVVKVKKILGTRAVGHMGTLDPQGEGVLLLGVGKATRLFPYFLSKDKVYLAEFDFGYETDTLDGDGTVVRRVDSLPTLENIDEATLRLSGAVAQVPPLYSAKSIGGRRAYDLARQGIEVELKPSNVRIYSIIRLMQTGERKHLFRIHCSSGTYVRSICRDIAYATSSLATMTSITRVRAGSFTIDDAVRLETLSQHGNHCLISLDAALANVPRFDAKEQDYKKICNGVAIDCNKYVGDKFFTLYCNGKLFGIAKNINGKAKITTYLKE